MNVQVLIDSVVRQTTVLLAQLATSGGARTPLSHVADQVFVALAAELESQGLSRKVTADMFGISLRSYQRKVQRLRESRTEEGRSLWEAVFDHLRQGQVITRAEVLARFRRDDPNSVRGILRDLVDSGLVFASGSGDDKVYRAVSREELDQGATRTGGMDAFVWALIYGEGPLSEMQIAERLALSADQVSESLSRLLAGGQVQRREGAPPCYASTRLVIERDASSGWEAAVYDHFQAVVRTICARLDRDTAREGYRKHIGGSTYGLDVHAAHPLREEALTTLDRIRAQLGDLRQRINAHNAQHPLGPDVERIVVYAGQCVLPDHATPLPEEKT